MTIIDNLSPAVGRVIQQQLDYAKEKHPEFSTAFAPSVIMEELGELAQLYNDYGDGKITLADFNAKATVECAHVAVTALRLLENLNGGTTSSRT